jgi:DNA repair protein RecO (recombination protein O)
MLRPSGRPTRSPYTIAPSRHPHHPSPTLKSPHSLCPVSRTYTVTGINLKAIPLGEADRLLTILSPERGLIQAVAPGARKQSAKLGGRSSLFVVNQLMLAQGKNLDRITQAEGIESFPGLATHLGRLTAGQYLAEVVLCQAIPGEPQADLFGLLCEHLRRIEAAPAPESLAYLCQALFHLLALAGLAPQVYRCGLSQAPIEPNFQTPDWHVMFSLGLGGIVLPDAESIDTVLRLNALELALMQQLAQAQLPTDRSAEFLQAVGSPPGPAPLELHLRRSHQGPSASASSTSASSPWINIERALRYYIQYHFDRPIRSATLLEGLARSS